MRANNEVLTGVESMVMVGSATYRGTLRKIKEKRPHAKTTGAIT